MDISNRRTYFRIIITLGFLIGLNPFSIDMYLPAFSSIAAGLNTDVATVGLSLASFLPASVWVSSSTGRFWTVSGGKGLL